MYALAGAAAASLTAVAWEKLGRVRGALFGIGLTMIVSLSASALWRFAFFAPALETAYLSPPAVGQIYAWLIEHTLAKGVRPIVLNEWHVVNSFGLQWEYYSRTRGNPADFNYQLASGRLAPEPTAAHLDRLRSDLAAISPAALVSIDGSPAGAYTGWQIVEPLWASLPLEPHPATPHYRVELWPSTYWDDVLAADFRDWKDFEMTRAQQRGEINLSLHLYRVLSP
jgi:hypothetical protein